MLIMLDNYCHSSGIYPSKVLTLIYSVKTHLSDS
jgi:hypothetical protein